MLKSSKRPLLPLVFIAVFVGAWLYGTADARPFRPSMYPNGSRIGCAACHFNPGGGGPRNAFGRAVEALVTPNGRQQFWSPSLAKQDSDGDGFTNGEEVGDPEGDGLAVTGAQVTNPGDPDSKPAFVNSAPEFSSAPPLEAEVGVAYVYTVVATDPDGDVLRFAKVSGPSWLTVSSAGVAQGTPPAGSEGLVNITIRASDDRRPAASTDQSFTINVKAAVPPTLDIALVEGMIRVTFRGVLQASPDLNNPNWEEIASEESSPLDIPIDRGLGSRFLRAIKK